MRLKTGFNRVRAKIKKDTYEMKRLLFSLLIANIIIPAPTTANPIGGKPFTRGAYFVCPQGVADSRSWWNGKHYRDYDREYNWVTKNMIDANLYVGKAISNYTDTEKRAIIKKMSNNIVQTGNQYKLQSIDYYSESGHPNILLTLRNSQGRTVKFKPEGWGGPEFWDANNKRYYESRMKHKNTEFFCREGILQERVAGVIELNATDSYGDPTNIPLLILVLDYFERLGAPDKSDAPAL